MVGVVAPCCVVVAMGVSHHVVLQLQVSHHMWCHGHHTVYGVVGVMGITPHGVVVMVAVIVPCGVTVTVIVLCSAAVMIIIIAGIMVGGWAVVGSGGRGCYASIGKEGGKGPW